MMQPRFTRRRSTLLTLLGLLALVVAAAVAVADPSVLQRERATRPAGAGGGTVVVPERFLRRWDPVTVFFPADTGPAGGGSEDRASRHARFSPEHPGAWTWLDARTLQFRPAEPWPALARYTWRAGGERSELSTLMSPPSATVPHAGAEGLDPVESITLTFPEPMALEALERMVTVELRPLPGVDGAAARLVRAGDFEIKAMERKGPSEPATYVITLDDPVPLGTRATLRFRLSEDVEAEASVSSLSFATAEPFRAASLGCSRARYPVTPEGTSYTPEQLIRCDAGRAEVWVDFSARPSDLGPVQARNLVRFEPAVSEMSASVQGKRLVVRADFDRDVLYKVSLAPTAIQDRRGRMLELEAASSVWLMFPRQAPYLKLGAGQGIVERLGPQTVPIEGRGHERADLRIHVIDPLDRSFWPFPAQPVGVNEDDRPPGPGEEPEPFTHPSRSISPAQLSQQIDALGSPAISTLVDLPLGPDGGAARFGLDLEEHLEHAAGRARPGTYLVGLRTLDGASTRSWMRVQVTDLSLSTLEESNAVEFVVASLSTGRAVSGAQLRLEGVRKERGEPELWETLYEGRTGLDGRLRWEAPGDHKNLSRRVRRIVVSHGDDQLVLNADDPPERYQDGLWSGMRSSWLQWAFEDLDRREVRAQDLCHVFSERPVYRLEQPVHLKGWVRRRDKGRLEPVHSEGTLEVQGPGDMSWRYELDLSETGGFYKHFAEDKLPSGTYSATFWTGSGASGQRARCAVTWQMEAYRLPRFEVDLNAPERTPLDREFQVELGASYYAGGRVAGRPVRWRVTQYPYDFAPEAREGFFYSSDGRFGRGRRFETTPAVDREELTDAQGSATLTLDPTIEPTAHPRTYLVEATVTGDDDQTVTSTTRVLALPPFVLGLKVPRFLEQASAIPVELLVADSEGELLADHEVTVRLLHRQWHSRLQAGDFSDGVARYVTDVVDEPVSEQVIRSGQQPGSLSLPIERAGVYVVELEAHDRMGRVQVVSVDLYAGGDEPVAWSKPSTSVFELTPDQDEYEPGDSAAIVFQSPFQKARALVVLEAPDGNVYEWLEVRGGSATWRVAIEDNWAPRIPVHVLLFRGRLPEERAIARSATDLDLGKPATLAATAWLAVDPVANRVEVSLDHPEKARPGEIVDVTVKLSDPKGRPLAGEVTLWLVDQAVLSLGKEQRLDPLPDFITQVHSRLGIVDTRNAVLGRLPFAEMPGGDGDEAEDSGPLDKATVRRNFQPVPFYDPAIQVPRSGVVRVQVQLPDNLTNFKLRAKAAAGPDRFGFAKGHLAVRLPVIVQPDLPRFVRPGDRFEAAAIGRVVEGEGGAGRAEIQVEGVSLQGAARQDLALDPQRATRIGFPVQVATPGYDSLGLPTRSEVSFTVGVERSSDGAADAFQVSLPLRPDRFPIAERALLELAAGEDLEIPALRAEARPGTLQRSLLVSSEPGLVHVASGMDFLLRYPYGCTEQRISRARAYVALGGLRELLHLERTPDDVDRTVNAALAWVAEVTDDDGLVGYWPGSGGNVWLTAWSVQFLVDAKEAGYPVDDALMADLLRALRQALRSDYGRFVDGESWTERAWALSALAAAGHFERAYFAELGRKASYLDAEGTAQVLLAGARAGQQDAPVSRDLVDKLAEMMIVRLHQGEEIYGGLQVQRRARNGLILPGETRSLASMARALARVVPEHERLPLLYDALVTLGRTDGWGDTNANAAAMLALADRLRNPSEDRPEVALRLSGPSGSESRRLGSDEPVGFWTLEHSQAVSLSQQPAGRGGDPLVVRSDAFYLPLADGSQEAASSRGFVVQRSLERVLGGRAPSEKLPLDEAGRILSFVVGEVLEDRVQVVVPEDRHHVAIVVPMAAGMEPLNPRLATAPPEATPSRGLTLQPSYADYADDQVAFFYNHLPKGTYDFTFRVRAFTPGRYIQPAARAEMMYDASVVGNSPGAVVTVERGGE